MTRKSSFPPVVAPDTRLLILGSLPGERSLAAGRYYAHPQNRFWHLVGHAIGLDLPALAYEQRLAALLAHGIGLWDVVGSATRSGSLDSAIRDLAANPLAELAGTLPQLSAVAFNGGAAARIGTKLLAGRGLELLSLPSSSPAYAAMTLAEKERRWQVIGMVAGKRLRVPPRQSIG
ncbi:DNA-deoxyinosine glycosylase [Croceibacterium sp. TMG7-5b_MA50]|uniref:DNA-deoxyinosine glycosylase n=1 Tax=Croceibacterium sp. TMG7-5b_MA50 TaxID=3121290 RepID=UPI00322209BB